MAAIVELGQLAVQAGVVLELAALARVVLVRAAPGELVRQAVDYSGCLARVAVGVGRLPVVGGDVVRADVSAVRVALRGDEAVVEGVLVVLRVRRRGECGQ